jgi:integrase
MRGTVIKRGTTWSVVIDRGRDGAGRRVRDWHSGFRTEKEAEKKRTELLGLLDKGAYAEPSKLTLGAFLRDTWLPAVRASVRASTHDSYTRMVDRHVVPALGGTTVQALTPPKLNAFYADLLASGLAPKTVRNVHAVLRKALGDAVRWGLLVRNVAGLAEAPKVSATRKPDMHVWTPEQLRDFLAGIEGERFYAALVLAAHTGLRRGEVLGLRWDDVDLEAPRLSVRQALLSVAYEVRVSDLKTDNGRRTVDLDARTVAVLRSWRREQLEERLAIGPGYRESGLVFTRPEGAAIHPDLFSKTFDRLVARSGLPVIRLHDLRHTHATLLLRASVPVKVVSERLGHANAAFTMNTYQHVLPGMQAEAAAVFAALVEG